MTIELHGISKRFGGTAAVEDVSLHVPKGSITALLGPSGSGKTTVLRVIAGLAAPDTGRVVIDGQDVTEVDVRERRIGFVFQHYALFRHMSVFDNVAFGLEVRGRPRAEVKARVGELLRAVRVEELARRLPAQLSGGQRQRVALARALATDPAVLLLDEPFGALDAQVRRELRQWLRELQRSLDVTVVLVTHDQEEAIELADRVAVMQGGRVMQVGTPLEITEAPANAFVAGFIGTVNRLPCKIEAGEPWAGPWRLPPGSLQGDAAAAVALVRPHELAVVPPGRRDGADAVVSHVLVLGPRARLQLRAGPFALEADVDRREAEALKLAPGIAVGVRPLHILLFPPAGSSRPALQRIEFPRVAA